MDTDIVIPLGKGSTMRNMELKFCLRSIEKHLKGVGNIFIVGERPGFLNDHIIHIPAEDDPRNRFRDRNIMNKMLLACKDERVSDDFLMVHDDHFLLADYEAGKFPYYHCGQMVPGEGQYGETKKNTINILWQINNYDTHCPILFNKELFMKSVPYVDWSKWYGYCLKTLYCVMNGIKGEYMDDIKIRMPLHTGEVLQAIAGRKWFSIGDRCFSPGMKEVLQTLYPNKSRYEAD